MRNLIVKYLALSYRVRLFGKEFVFVRAANVIVPLMLLLGYALIAQFAWLKWLALAATLVVWLLVTVYLKLYPVKWEELDEEQKRIYGNLSLWGQLGIYLTHKQYAQWKAINIIYKSNPTKWYNVGAFMIVPLAVIVFIVVII